jgi:hypothetical protein
LETTESIVTPDDFLAHQPLQRDIRLIIQSLIARKPPQHVSFLNLRICQQIVQDGLALGVKCFVVNIEAPDPEMNTPAYRNFEALGFKRPY